MVVLQWGRADCAVHAVHGSPAEAHHQEREVALRQQGIRVNHENDQGNAKGQQDEDREDAQGIVVALLDICSRACSVCCNCVTAEEPAMQRAAPEQLASRL